MTSPTEIIPLCPSAQPEMAESVAFAIIGGTVDEPRAIPLVEPRPVTPELLAMTEPVKPTEVFRFAAPCAGSQCAHFDRGNCRLVQRTIALLPVVSETLPACRIRAECRWWLQEGRAACMRCPQVITENWQPSDEARQAADPFS